MVTIDYGGVSTKFMIILTIELGIWVIRACRGLYSSLLPPKLQRRGLVFEFEFGDCGACIMGYNGAYMMGYFGIEPYEHVPISYGVVTLFKAIGYCRL